MKKSIKVFLLILGIFISLILGFFTYYLVITAGVKINPEKLINVNASIEFFDSNGESITKESSMRAVTSINEIPENLKNAFIAIEDKRFYKHSGIDYKGLFRAAFKNLTSFSFKEGASTITQQLIKNTHLSGKKTLNRKLKEIKLAKQIEKKYSKEEILEKYLNTIYFGDSCYGITKASSHFFNKNVSNLSLEECATLAGMVKAPYYYSPKHNAENCIKRRNVVLNEMKEQGYIDNPQYLKAVNTGIKIEVNESDKYDYLYLSRNEVFEILKNSSYSSQNLKVYTYYSKEKQQILEDAFSKDSVSTDKSGIILGKNNEILAYSSTAGEIKRQLGSVIKPILVYGPAIEENEITEITPILDEKTSFGGYSPSNFGDKYHGYVSAKFSLAKSLNTPAIKIMNSVGIDKCFKYLNKTDISFLEEDKNLSSALGSLKNGAKLSEITASYGVFNSNGVYNSPKTIEKIVYNGKVIYKNTPKKERVFSEETAFIADDMLKATVEFGTAKQLNNKNWNLRAKTGTAGIKNGNTDAYAISYNEDYILGIWYGNKDYKLMPNSITGGTYPLNVSNNIWTSIYNIESYPIANSKPSGIVEKYVDSISLEKNNKIMIADKNSPEKYKIKAYFKNSNCPKETSTRFSSPYINSKEISVKNNRIYIHLCVEECYNYKVFKKANGKKTCIYDSLINTGEISDGINGETVYSVIPYVVGKEKVVYGKEEVFPKIKSPIFDIGDDWILFFD